MFRVVRSSLKNAHSHRTGRASATAGHPGRPGRDAVITGVNLRPVVLGLLCLALAALVIAYEVTGYTPSREHLGFRAFLGFGGLLVVIGGIGLVTRRRTAARPAEGADPTLR